MIFVATDESNSTFPPAHFFSLADSRENNNIIGIFTVWGMFTDDASDIRGGEGQTLAYKELHEVQLDDKTHM